jgi:hypothetical protein
MRQRCAGAMVILCVFAGVFIARAGFGQEAAALKVKDPAICTNVESRACVDPKAEFALPVDRLYCFTRITGASGNTDIAHVWYYGDVERARIPLAVRTGSYRTYSYKTIQPHETGKWHVDVVDSSGTVLETIPFEVVP